MTRPADPEEPSGPPLLRVVRGDPTPEEIAGLVAALATRAADDVALSPVRSAEGSWSDRSRQLRPPVFPGPRAWRRSALPG